MIKSSLFALGAVLAAGMVFTSPAPSRADLNYWTGYVVHVSTENIKVMDKAHGRTLSFLILPKFKQLFSDDGKTTYQMASLRPGMIVRVVYDQDLLGARHADKIFVVSAHGYPLKTL